MSLACGKWQLKHRPEITGGCVTVTPTGAPPWQLVQSSLTGAFNWGVHSDACGEWHDVQLPCANGGWRNCLPKSAAALL